MSERSESIQSHGQSGNLGHDDKENSYQGNFESRITEGGDKTDPFSSMAPFSLPPEELIFTFKEQ